MAYLDIVTGLHTRFAAAGGITKLLAYEPTAIHEPPVLYSLLDRVTYEHAGQVKATRYRILHRLCFRWQDYEQAELELMPFVDAIPASVRADPRLGGALGRGLATISEAQGVFVKIGGATYRALDFYSDVLDKS